MPARTKDKRRRCRRLSFVSSVICLAASLVASRNSGKRRGVTGSAGGAGVKRGLEAHSGAKDARDMGLHG